MRERFRHTHACLLALTLACAAGAQDERPELRDLAHWSGNVWQRLQAMPVTDHVADGHDVFTMAAKTRKRVSGDVYVISASCVDLPTHAWLNSHFDETKLALLASRFGTRYRTNDEGVARVAMPSDGMVFALCGDRLGQCRATPQRTFVMTRQHATIRLEIVNENGRPLADVPVKAGHLSNRSELATACSDGSGRVELRVSQDMLSQPLFVEAKIAGPKRGTALMPRDYFDKTPALLQVRVPRTGQLRATIADPVGVLPARGSSARLTWQGDKSYLANAGLSPSRWHDGTAVFSHVALGLTVTTKMSGGSRAAWRRTTPGPQSIDVTRQVTVTVGDDQFAVRGRLIGDDHTIAAGRHRVRIAGTAGVHDDRCIVDELGRFLFAIDNARFPEGDLRIEIFVDKAARTAPGIVAIAHIADKQRGVVEVGDLQLTKEDTVVRGRLMRGDKPMHGRVSSPLANDRDGPIVHRVTAGPDGRFVMFEAEPGEGQIELIVQSGWPLKEEKVTATIGDEEQVFQLAPSRDLTFTVKDRRNLSMFRYVARPKAAGAPPVNGHATADGFAFANLGPGPHEVVVTFGACELFRIDDLDADTKPNDPRCRDITWRQNLAMTRLTITDGTGKPLRATCYVATGKQNNALPRVVDPRGRVELPYADGHEFFIRQGQHRAEIVTPTREPQTIQMRRRALLHLRLPKGLKLPASAELHFSSELAQFGLKDHVHHWLPGQLNAVLPEANQKTVLRVRMRDARGQYALLHEQAVPLPATDKPIEVLVGIDDDDASFAADLETARAALRKGRER